MKKKILTFALAICATIGISQTSNFQKLDSLFSLLEKNNKFMGSISISQNQKTIYEKTIGYTDIENSIEANRTSKYRIGSISKIFTASLIFKAIEDEKLALDQTIDKFFPAIKNGTAITIKNLLNHSSGIHDFTRDEEYSNWSTLTQSKQQMIERISNGATAFNPNERGEYSNSNYVLLTFILEKVYNTPFPEILENSIISPLNLKSTYYGGKTDIRGNESYSYKYSGQWKKEPETDMSIPQGAGALVSNPTDLNTFIEHLFLGKIVSEESLESMKTIKNGYGMGLFQFPYDDKVSYGHTGGIDGFQSVTSYFPEDKLAISMTANGIYYRQNNVLLAALATFYNKPFELPNFKNIVLTSDALEKFLGTYSSEQIPPKITFTKDGNTLFTQATGQGAFPLEATAENIFTYEPAGVKIEFNPSEKTMILYQGGKEFKFKKD